MVYGYYPFNPADPGLPKKMMEGRISYPPGVAVSQECRDMIQGEGAHPGAAGGRCRAGRGWFA